MIEHKLVKLPIFNRQFYMYKGPYGECLAHFNKKYHSNFPIEVSENYGTCINFPDGSSIILVHKECHGTVAHELSHATTGFMTNLLKDTDRDHGDEIVSYITGYLTEKWYETKGWVNG
jgi:Zn-dependent metalloprotease